VAGSLRWIGHATVRIDLDGVRLLTDPLLRNRIAHLRRSGRVDAAAGDEVDVVLLSHGHLDHLDVPSLRRFAAVPVLVPRGLGPLLRRKGLGAVTEVDEGDELRFGGVTVRAVEANHEGGRPPFPSSDVRALGFVVEGSSRVYFAGDTDLFDAMDGLVPELDVALLPIWGWGPSLGRGAHMDPARAAEAARRLRPRIVVPIHWGTYFPAHLGLRGAPAFVLAPAARFVRAAAETAPDVEVRVLAPGEEMPF
jgi:L-ascorbate metabolism protein UlaG (beta-lactamase superfamily)